MMRPRLLLGHRFDPAIALSARGILTGYLDAVKKDITPKAIGEYAEYSSSTDSYAYCFMGAIAEQLHLEYDYVDNTLSQFLISDSDKSVINECRRCDTADNLSLNSLIVHLNDHTDMSKHEIARYIRRNYVK